MKKLLGSAVRRLAPRTMQSLQEIADARAQTGNLADALRRVAELQDEVRALKAEIDECRRDNLRIAELYDLTVERLGAPDRS